MSRTIALLARAGATVATALLAAGVATTAATAAPVADGAVKAARSVSSVKSVSTHDHVHITEAQFAHLLGTPTTTMSGTDAWTIDRRVWNALRDNPGLTDRQVDDLVGTLSSFSPDPTSGAWVIDITTGDLGWLFGPADTSLPDEGGPVPAWTISRNVLRLFTDHRDVTVVPRHAPGPDPQIQTYRSGLETHQTTVRLDPTTDSPAVGTTSVSCNTFADGVPTYVDVPGDRNSDDSDDNAGRWYRLTAAGGWVKNWGWCI